ncbi:hypothetical protein LCGC14_3155990 [marine sediment metagenome]|uniref:Uncharacterized protein n=1 Tax=marine sediment metagenome TaxID=412755 RepID=A0A0F8VST7_9ZZZZ
MLLVAATTTIVTDSIRSQGGNNMEKSITKGKCCQAPGCRKPAKSLILLWNTDEVKVYCIEHSDEAANNEKRISEYFVHCPNCKCGFGVN